MKFLSALVTSASGSIGGMTASRNRGGMYLRSRVTPVNPSTGRQQFVRNSMSQLVGLWNQALDAAQRESWDQYAQAVPMQGSLGSEVQLSGVNHFVRTNSAALRCGLSIIEEAPVNFSLAPAVILDGSGVTNAGSSNLVVEFDDPEDWTESDLNYLLVYCSRPENEGKVPRGPFRFAGFDNGDSVTPPSSYTFDTPFVMSAGQRVRIEARLLLADGRLSSRSAVDVIVGSA